MAEEYGLTDGQIRSEIKRYVQNRYGVPDNANFNGIIAFVMEELDCSFIDKKGEKHDHIHGRVGRFKSLEMMRNRVDEKLKSCPSMVEYLSNARNMKF